MTDDASWSIGEIVALLENEFPDLTISKVRFLESKGLVDPERTPSGYRQYRSSDLAQLRWVLTRQRDDFLPLRVISDLLSSGQYAEQAPGDGQADPALAERRRIDPLRPAAATVQLTSAELRQRAGLTTEQLTELEGIGLLEPVTARGRAAYDADALAVAQVAARFLGLGLEPRHLRAYKVAADREASLLQQRTGYEAQDERARLLAQLVALGDEIRALLLRSQLAR